MPLGVISRVSFGFGVIFGEKLKKWKTRKSWPKRVPTPPRREPTPWRRPTPQRGVPSPWRGRGAKMAPTRVRYDVASLRRSVAVLHCCVDTIHARTNFGFLFLKSSIRTSIV